MSELIHYECCPACGSPDFNSVLHVKDHTVSGETFTIAECRSCTLRFTQDVPPAAAIGPYYKSDDYISHSDTGKGMINRLYHWVRKRTITRKRKLVQSITGKKTGNLLDVGSGTGAFVSEMKKHQWQAVGLEPDEGARSMAKQLYQVELSDISQFYHLPAAHFDAITLWHVLEHVHDLDRYIQQLKSLINEKGRIFIAVPNYTSHDATVYREFWAAYDVPRHLYHFSPKSMQLLMSKHGLNILQYLPMWYDSIYISLMSSRYRNNEHAQKGNTNWVSAAFTGTRSNFNALREKTRCSSIIYVIGK